MKSTSHSLAAALAILFGHFETAPAHTASLRVGEEVLKHDDGRADDKRSMAGAGHAVRFEVPQTPFTVTKVMIHGARYGGGYDPLFTMARVRLRDEAFGVLAETYAPYSLWEAGRADWAEVPIGPIVVPERFFLEIELFPTQSKGVYVSIDEEAAGHSFRTGGGQLSGPIEGGGWMLRVGGTTGEIEVESVEPDTDEWKAYGEGDCLDKRSMAGGGHALELDPPSRKHLLTGLALFGSRYGGEYDPETQLFHVFVCDRKLEPIARFAFPYALFPAGEMQWVELDLPPIEVPRGGNVIVAFDPTAQRGVYLGIWEEPKAVSTIALPGGSPQRMDRKRGWMLRARFAKSAGKRAVTAPAPSVADGPSAVELADRLAEIEEAERAEDADRANELVRKLAEIAPESARQAGKFTATEHFFLRAVGAPEEAVRSLERVLEQANQALHDRFGIERLAAKGRVHVHLGVDSSAETKLFTSPTSKDFPLVVFRGPESALEPPSKSGTHVVYGFCHELGHVLMAWDDDRHKWAHYVGSVATSAVHEALGDEGWWVPYDFASIEGMPRYLREIEGVKPGTGSDEAVASLFHAIGERFGTEVYGRALAWIRANRTGEPFGSYRTYPLADLRAALEELTGEPEAVRALFGS